MHSLKNNDNDPQRTLSQPIDSLDEGPASSAGGDDHTSALHLRTTFLRRLAHDIASPTGVMMMVLGELAAESSKPELLVMARRGLRRLLRLSEQLALVAELEAGALLPDTMREDIRGLVKDAVDQAVAIDGRRDIVTSCDLPSETVVADVDRKLIGGVVREVVGNALRLARSSVAVEVATAGSNVEIRVHDDGPGLAEDVLATLGQRFRPGSSTRGLGLSLSVAMEVLAPQHGELRVEASALPPGRRGVRGTAFIITLPRA